MNVSGLQFKALVLTIAILLVSDGQAHHILPKFGIEFDKVIKKVADKGKEAFDKVKEKVKEKVKDVVKKFRFEWEINIDLCPPILCGGNEPSGAGFYGGKFPFFEGDIVLDTHLQQKTDKPKRRRRLRRAIVRPIKRLWKYGIVPYTIDSTLSRQTQNLIHAAIDHYQRRTCIEFKPKTDEDKDYIYFVNQPGCWSFVGRKQGIQYMALGSGCEKFGTVVHEMGHALGFWHEQSRPDRDKYIKLIKKNISPSRQNQFGKRKEDESTSRGFAYDYESIMHYGNTYFTLNGKPTIKVRGIGRKLKFKIGQRDGLSDIDVAQIEAMYYCNKKELLRKACNGGYIKHGTSCYKFFANEKNNFGGAKDKCRSEGGHLLHINSKDEDDFIKTHLIKHYPKVKIWRTGARKVGKKLFWMKKSAKDKTAITYKAWAPNHPGKYSSMALVLFKGTPRRFVWRGIHAGSKKQLPKYSYPFICESNPKNDCFQSRYNDGRDYRGNLDYSNKGVRCQRWTSSYPHRHSTMTGNTATDRANGLGGHNYCRNPGGRRAKPWCYVLLDKVTWQYCDIELCKQYVSV